MAADVLERFSALIEDPGPGFTLCLIFNTAVLPYLEIVAAGSRRDLGVLVSWTDLVFWRPGFINRRLGTPASPRDRPINRASWISR